MSFRVSFGPAPRSVDVVCGRICVGAVVACQWIIWAVVSCVPHTSILRACGRCGAPARMPARTGRAHVHAHAPRPTSRGAPPDHDRTTRRTVRSSRAAPRFVCSEVRLRSQFLGNDLFSWIALCCWALKVTYRKS